LSVKTKTDDPEESGDDERHNHQSSNQPATDRRLASIEQLFPLGRSQSLLNTFSELTVGKTETLGTKDVLQ
jgi:hypothetical protein